MTRARAKAIHDKVNSFLSMCDIDPTLDGTLPHANALCILRYEPHGGRQVDTEEDGGSQREGREETGPTGSEPASRSPSRTPAGRTGSQPAQPEPADSETGADIGSRPASRPPAGASGSQPG